MILERIGTVLVSLDQFRPDSDQLSPFWVRFGFDLFKESVLIKRGRTMNLTLS